jgi:ABC-type transport system involved in cytochrome bd biosynthesis fused ATPase/permease subunit
VCEQDDRVLRRVAQALSYTLPARPAFVADAENDLEALAQAYGLRTRRVALDDRLWQRGGLPLIVWQQGIPIALLPDAHGYRWEQAGQQQKITPQIAAQFEPHALLIYPPLASKPVSITQLLTFGWHWSDGWRVLLTAVLNGMAWSTLPVAAHSLAQGQPVGVVLPLVVSAVITSLFLSYAQTGFTARLSLRMDVLRTAALQDRLLRLETPAPPSTAQAIHQLTTATWLQTGLRGIELGVLLLIGLGLGLGILWGWVLVGLGLVLAMPFFVPLNGANTEPYLQRLRLLVRGIPQARVRGPNHEVAAYADWQTDYENRRQGLIRVQRAQVIVTAGEALLIVVGVVLMLPVLQGDGAVLRGGLALLIGWQAVNFLRLLRTALPELCGQLAHLQPLLNATLHPPRPAPASISGAVELRGMSCGLLQELSLRIPEQQCVAVIGPNGAGKSLLLRAIFGLEALDQGEILFDEQAMSAVSLSGLRAQIGAVLPQSRIYPGSLYFNIVGYRPLPMEAAWEAARIAQIEPFIRALPMGMQTIVDEGGGVLSHGERIRVLIARAVAQRPRLLLLDDVTSALDEPTEAALMRQLLTLDATLVLVTQRPSVLAFADQVVVLEAGRLAPAGVFAQWWGQQGWLPPPVTR